MKLSLSISDLDIETRHIGNHTYSVRFKHLAGKWKWECDTVGLWGGATTRAGAGMAAWREIRRHERTLTNGR